jgi:hypothetical protein
MHLKRSKKISKTSFRLGRSFPCLFPKKTVLCVLPDKDGRKKLKTEVLNMENDKQKTARFEYEIRKTGGVTVQADITLPLSDERYAELGLGLKPESEAWQTVRNALANLAFLQGGALGAWSVELEIQNERRN